jgi:hypothetical protein
LASPFDAVGDASTLGGVVVGALVATLGSFGASWYERRQLRRERETDAALVFAEILRTLAIQTAIVKATHARGDPFGPITIRMVRSVRREVEIYDRNRERLFVVRDAGMRAQSSAVMARLTFAVDRVLDNSDALAGREIGEADRGELTVGRDQAFEFLVECAEELPTLVDRFATLAGTHLPEFDLASVGFGPPRGEQT